MRTLSSGEATRNETLELRLAGSASRLWTEAGPKARCSLALLAHLALALCTYTVSILAASQDRGGWWAAAVLRETIGILIVLRLAGILWFQLHRQSLRHPNPLDLVAILKSVSVSGLLFWFTALLLLHRPSLPAVVFVMDAALLILFWGGLHFGSRILRAWEAVARGAGKPVLIVGAGDAAVAVLKELTLNSESLCQPVAIVDDDRQKWGRSICGIPVEGGISDVARLVAQKKLAEILVCIPSASRPQMREILEACRQSNVPVRTLPCITELAGGKVTREDFRRPRIEDLLQRDGIDIDVEETRNVVGGKSVLVTGAGGSIGSELCRQIAAANPRKLLLLDHSENSLFYAHLGARERLGPDRAKPLLMDLLEREFLREMMQREKPDIVFHAAAHKHVGLIESHAREGMRNNVLSTRNVAEAAVECGTRQFVNISTDKAVRPENYMGASKKLAELCIQEVARQSGRRFCSVRFGNVADSTGSVMRLFWDQIQNGGPVRVTDPRATRYFMTIPEAVHLILRAAALSSGGETFVFDMGEPMNIFELARTMMLFAGLKPGVDIAIEFTGLQAGEKLHEELREEWERAMPTDCPRVLAIRDENPAARGILAKVRNLETILALERQERLLKFIQEIIPEFRRASPHTCAVRVAAAPANSVEQAGAA